MKRRSDRRRVPLSTGPAVTRKRRYARQPQSLQQMLALSERDRQLFACEIHDGFVQSVAAGLMNVEASLSSLLSGSTPQFPVAIDGLKQAVRMLRGAVSEARQLINNLQPPMLDDLGIVAALEHLVTEAEAAGDVRVQLLSDVEFTRRTPSLEAAVYRIVQEGLNNALRHSGSHKVEIRLRQQAGRLRIRIQDWGSGFDPCAVDASRFGLRGMRKRVKLFGGRMAVRSAPGQGTRLIVELPLLNDSDADCCRRP